MESIAPDQNKSKLKRGEVRGDGMVFAFVKRGKEVWKTPEDFEVYLEKSREAVRKYDAANQEKRIAARKVRYDANPEKNREAARKYRADNPEKTLERSRAGHEKFRERERAQARQWNKNNPEKHKANFKRWREKNPEKAKEHARNWARANREKLNEWRRDRHASDPKWAMAMRCRSRLGYALHSKGFKKESKTADMLGCSWEQLCAHLETFFTDEINWDTRDKWHVDHIIPLASAKTMDELKELAKWTNLQPLLGPDNLAKSDKMPDELK